MNNQSGNKILLVDSYEKLLELWPFLLGGLEATRLDCKDNLPDVSNDQFFKTLLAVATGLADGVTIVLTSKNDKPLGFIVLCDTTALYEPKTLTIYIAYSTGKCPSTIHELRYEGHQWALKQGFERVRALSFRVKPHPRLSGAVRRYFNKTLGLRERCVVFETSLQSI